MENPIDFIVQWQSGSTSIKIYLQFFVCLFIYLFVCFLGDNKIFKESSPLLPFFLHITQFEWCGDNFHVWANAPLHLSGPPLVVQQEVLLFQNHRCKFWLFKNTLGPKRNFLNKYVNRSLLEKLCAYKCTKLAHTLI